MKNEEKIYNKFTSGEITITLENEELAKKLYDLAGGDEGRAEYEFIKNALEKQIPMEHHHTRIAEIKINVRESVCPRCLGIIATANAEYPNYCTWCGQWIDWRDKK